MEKATSAPVSGVPLLHLTLSRTLMMYVLPDHVPLDASHGM